MQKIDGMSIIMHDTCDILYIYMVAYTSCAAVLANMLQDCNFRRVGEQARYYRNLLNKGSIMEYFTYMEAAKNRIITITKVLISSKSG